MDYAIWCMNGSGSAQPSACHHCRCPARRLCACRGRTRHEPVRRQPRRAPCRGAHRPAGVCAHDTQRLIDIVGEGFDAGIRLGEMIAQDMVTVRLTPRFKAVIVASPAYVGRHGRPRGVADLANHNCIGYRLVRSGALYRWDLAEDGKDVVVEAKGTVIVTDSLAAIDLALAGVGLAYVFEPLVRADLAAGRLVQVLPQSAIEEPGLF